MPAGEMANRSNVGSRQKSLEGVNPTSSSFPVRLRFLAIALRTIFLVCLLLVTYRVSIPQSETFWTVYESPGDMVRLVLGLGVGIFILVHLVRLPRAPEAYQTWAYLGLVAAPFALVVAAVLWRH
jgi:hypothetical protein